MNIPVLNIAHPGKRSTAPHTWVEHKDCQNPGSCRICDGGLAVCAICGCYEGSLPTDCPGVKCYSQYGEAIYSGEIDFVKGRWVKEVSIHSPVFYRMQDIIDIDDLAS